MSDGFPLGDGRHHFFESRSFSALAIVLGPMADKGSLSSMASASRRFSLAFSSSSTFSRLAAFDGQMIHRIICQTVSPSMPPNFAFQA